MRSTRPRGTTLPLVFTLSRIPPFAIIAARSTPSGETVRPWPAVILFRHDPATTAAATAGFQPRHTREHPVHAAEVSQDARIPQAVARSRGQSNLARDRRNR